jgi:hypothetical protein
MTKTLDLDRLARELGVPPPPLPLSPEGQGNVEKLLREPITDEAEPSELSTWVDNYEERQAKRRAILEAGRAEIPHHTTRGRILAPCGVG